MPSGYSATETEMRCTCCGKTRWPVNPDTPYVCWACRKATHEKTCTRCGGTRWSSDPVRPFVCQRCREVLAGQLAMDPVKLELTEAQQAVRAANLRLAQARRSQKKPQA